jgi:hypothetical protein
VVQHDRSRTVIGYETAVSAVFQFSFVPLLGGNNMQIFFWGAAEGVITLELHGAASRRPGARTEGLAAMSEDSPLL